MVVGTTKNVVNNISFSLKKIIKDITGLRVISTVGKGANKSLNNLGKFVGKVPLGGKVVGYMFKQSGKGIVIVATTADNLINNAGNIAIDVLSKTRDLTVLTLNTAKGGIKKLTGNRTRRRRRRKSGKKVRKGRTRGRTRGKKRRR